MTSPLRRWRRQRRDSGAPRAATPRPGSPRAAQTDASSRRVVLVVSDLHLGTGNVLPDGTVNARDLFRAERQFIEFLEYHRTGEYRQVEVELVINGDFIEGLQPDEWTADPDMITEERAVALTEQVVRGHAAVFEALAQFAEDPLRQVTVTVGNHDQLLFFDGVRAVLERALGEVTFALHFLRRGRVHIEHGNQREPVNHFDAETPIVTEGLPAPILQLPLGSDLVVTWVNRLKQIRHYTDRVRPFRLLISWSWVHDFRFAVKAFWTFATTLIAARFRPHAARRRGLLRTLFTLLRPTPIKTLERPAREILTEHPDVDLVVLGHSHSPMHRSFPEVGEYINTGTWVETISLHPGSLGRHLRLTYARLEWEGPEDAAVMRASLRRWYGRYRLEDEFHP